VADIPGLIAGAHEGMGMGIQFLRHVERTSVLLHLIDISEEPNTNALKNYNAIIKELKLYNPQLLEKAQIVALNKIDLPQVKEKVKKSVAQFSKKGIILHPFSAATGVGLQDILRKIVTVLNKT
jgi:GTP-binding protein